MVEPHEQLTILLKKYGLNITAPRRAVFTALLRSGPVSMPDLIKTSGTTDRASVYRSVKLYEELGVIQRLQIGWKYKLELSNMFQHHHHHLHCTGCGSVITIPEDPTLENRLLSIAGSRNFKAQDHQIEIRGLCSSCQ